MKMSPPFKTAIVEYTCDQNTRWHIHACNREEKNQDYLTVRICHISKNMISTHTWESDLYEWLWRYVYITYNIMHICLTTNCYEYWEMKYAYFRTHKIWRLQ